MCDSRPSFVALQQNNLKAIAYSVCCYPKQCFSLFTNKVPHELVRGGGFTYKLGRQFRSVGEHRTVAQGGDRGKDEQTRQNYS